MQHNSREQKKCMGFGGCQCDQSCSRSNVDYCDSCYQKLIKKKNFGLCTGQNGTCAYPRYKDRSWCTACFLTQKKDAVWKTIKSHDCDRGGCICSICEGYEPIYEEISKLEEDIERFKNQQARKRSR